ncbi:CPBP family intramembrane metalloprotease [Clostridium butyricum]|uniref:CPBP family intramembrane glutamic endopeptidase n=1 Tax=Clostridium butyricum TaxID=1492 RepID=UPI001CA995C4|nr:CPBP family intramembrane glutamic endopeptidase [Clostridium butyricum]MBZ0312402.1 CPBP family intramembrane metalloprotease [Clostridium butyricum]
MKIQKSFFDFIVKIIIAVVCYCITCIIFIFILTKLEVDFKEYVNDLEYLYIVILAFLFFNSNAEDSGIFMYLKKDFVKTKSLYVITLPIIIALLENIITDISRYIPLYWGGTIINIGSNQAIINLNTCTIEYWICFCIFPAFNEEMIFRFFMYRGLLLFLNGYNIDKLEIKDNDHFIKKIASKINRFVCKCMNKVKNDLFIEKKDYAVIGWIIVTSTLFALAHGTDFTNFYMYFIPGTLFAMLYLKYGLLSSMLCHMLGNYSSPIIHYCFKLILKNFSFI